MIAVGSGAGDCGGGCGGGVGGPRDQTAGTGGGGGGGVGQLLHRQAALNDSWPGTSLTSCGAAQALDQLRLLLLLSNSQLSPLDNTQPASWLCEAI